jgi:hypothetical protein
MLGLDVLRLHRLHTGMNRLVITTATGSPAAYDQGIVPQAIQKTLLQLVHQKPSTAGYQGVCTCPCVSTLHEQQCSTNLTDTCILSPRKES